MLLVTDKYYNKHVLVIQIETLTDGAVKLLEKVRYNNIYSLNRSAVKEELYMLIQKDVARGEWILCQTFIGDEKSLMNDLWREIRDNLYLKIEQL